MKNTGQQNWERVYSVLFALIFFAALLIQLAGSGLRVNKIADIFLWRKPFIKTFNTFRYSIGDRVFNEGLVGGDGWLFYSGDFSIHDYQKTSPVPNKQLKELARILRRINEQTAQYGGTMLLVIPPDKNTIYPEYMPDEIPVLGETSRLEQFIEYIKQNTQVQVLDLRPILANAARETQIYYKYDAHWNCIGAYYASNEIISRLSVLYPQMKTHPLSDYEQGTFLDSSLDISSAMGLGLEEIAPTLTPKFQTGSITYSPYEKNELIKVAENTQTDLPSAVILHDSFYTECLHQFLEPQFRRTLPAPFGVAGLEDYLTLIDEEKPNVVIIEFAERHIEYFYRLTTR